MPRVLLAIGLALCLGQIAAAQDSPEWQVYAGGSYGHAEISPAIPGLSSVNGWGYNIDVEQYVNRWIGGVIEFGDYYRRPTIDLAPFGFPGTREQVRTHFVDLLLGPQVRRNFGKVTPFGRAALGFSRRIIDEQAGFITSDKNAFAFGAGGGIDIRVREHVAVRPIEGDFLLTHFALHRQSNWTVSAGVVFCWGQK
jgi:opacity protein-like surface antigen